MKQIARDTLKFVVMFTWPYWVELPLWLYNDEN
jgi:hypothetical protein